MNLEKRLKIQVGIFYFIFSIVYSLLNYYFVPAQFILPFFLITGMTIGIVLFFGSEMIILNFLYRMVVFTIFNPTAIPQNLTISVASSFIYLVIAKIMQYFIINNEERNTEWLDFIITIVVALILIIYGVIALSVQSPVLGYTTTFELSIIFALADVFGMIVILPLMFIWLDKIDYPNELLQFNLDIQTDNTPRWLYLGIFGYSLSMIFFIFSTPYYDLLIFLIYLPLMVLAFQYRIKFAIYSTAMVNLLLTFLYSAQVSGIHQLNQQEQIIFQIFVITLSQLVLFVGYNATQVEHEKRRRRESEMQLIFAQKSELVNRMAGGLAHEVNNANQIIAGFTDILSMKIEQPENDEITEIIEQIQSAVDRTSDFMKQMMTISSNHPPKPELCRVDELIYDNLSAYRTIATKSYPIVVDLQPTPEILIDPSQINQVLINLVSNARDASTTMVPINISTSIEDFDRDVAIYDGNLKSGKYIKIMVSDQGSGIDPKKIHLIFEPFYTTKLSEEGMGLGLSIVHALIKSNRGILDIKSHLGYGTQVSIYFPVDPNITTVEYRVNIRDIEDTMIHSRVRKILIIDDEKDIGDMLERLLKEFHRDVSTYNDPIHLLEAESDRIRKFDLIIADVIMPDLGGIELVQKLRNLHPGLAVVIMSGYPKQEINPKYFNKMGFVSLVKPFSKPNLIQAINAAYQFVSKEPSQMV